MFSLPVFSPILCCQRGKFDFNAAATRLQIPFANKKNQKYVHKKVWKQKKTTMCTEEK